MVGILLVSHVQSLADGVKDLAGLVAPSVPIVAVGGLSDGSAGTDVERIYTSLKEADQGDGVLIFMDLGSAVMSTEMALEIDPNDNYIMMNSPMVEGAIVAASAIEAGSTLEEAHNLVESQKGVDKF
ncbi:MAG: PTS-dependent dihydroxyacetone kinase phosphotransferase subunit DhaM [Clostridiaceae bacterium]|nr:dihydroxyacetone kinase phosphoryl donor subunit DhaM [Bacillota bacterium]NLN51805.1 PTS-dependent dihydroxyacetone kinase phosphotransferase subunit DhaM [Clostridiaceae bacterium]